MNRRQFIQGTAAMAAGATGLLGTRGVVWGEAVDVIYAGESLVDRRDGFRLFVDPRSSRFGSAYEGKAGLFVSPGDAWQVPLENAILAVRDGRESVVEPEMVEKDGTKHGGEQAVLYADRSASEFGLRALAKGTVYVPYRFYVPLPSVIRVLKKAGVL